MKALCLPLGRPLEPFGDAPGALRVLDRPLAEVQREHLREAGFEPVERAPDGERHLVYSDRTWFTPETLRRLRSACGEGVGRLRVEDPDFLAGTGALQDWERPGLYELAIVPPGGSLAQVPEVVVDLGLSTPELPALHPRMQHVGRPLRVGPAMVHQLDHWSHLVRVNQLALGAQAAIEQERFRRAPFWRKAAIVLRLLARAGWPSRHRLARALCQVGRDVDIHPTAVVELSVLGDGVRVGPHAVVRASVLGAGAQVDEHATLSLSVVGARARVGRGAMVNLSTLLPDCWVSWCHGLQASVVGEGAFLAWGCTLLDMSFGRTIRVRHRGERVDSGLHFLGVAVGHRAVVGHAVKLNYGVELPNDAVLVASVEGLLKDWGEAPVGQPCRVEEGRAVAVAARGAARDGAE